MATIISILTGPGGLYAVLMAAIGAALLWARRSGVKAERNKQRAKDADSYEQSLKDLADAGNARPTGRVSDDPYNRDR